MSAADTALRVLRWAAAEGRPGPLPRGGFRLPEELLAPDEELRGALGELAAVTAARLRLGNPPLGDSRAPGLDGLVLAFALGCYHLPELAEDLLATLGEPSSAWEWLIRHGLIAPALPFLPEALADECRLASPLTALFDRPAGERDAAALDAAARMRRHPAAGLALRLHLARPSQGPAVRRWRTRLLETLRAEGDAGRAFVLDVYEAAMVHHEDEVLEQSRRALEVFRDPAASQAPRHPRDTGAIRGRTVSDLYEAGALEQSRAREDLHIPMQDSRRIEDAISAADTWGPLWAIERSHLGALRERRYLGYAYREGLRVYSYGRKLRGL